MSCNSVNAQEATDWALATCWTWRSAEIPSRGQRCPRTRWGARADWPVTARVGEAEEAAELPPKASAGASREDLGEAGLQIPEPQSPAC